jgi:hypothetical protein
MSVENPTIYEVAANVVLAMNATTIWQWSAEW